MKFFIILSALFALATAVPVEMTLQQIDSALSNPNTNPALIPILEQALNMIMEALMNGQQLETVTVNLPMEVAPGIIEPENPIAQEPAPVEPSPVPVPVKPMPVPATAGPLVQVIVNINKKQQVTNIPNPAEVAVNPPPSPSNPIDVILN